MNADTPYRPEDLTAEQSARYKELSNSMTEEEMEVAIREILAHPESWVSAEQVMKDVEAICGNV